MSKKKSSNPHLHVRNDHSTETAEDYVEAIDDILLQQGQCRIADLAKKFEVSHVTVHRIVSRLQVEGLLTTQPYKPVELTIKGRKLANEARHRHKIVLAFLIAIGVDERTASIDAEGIEHHVSPTTLEKLEEVMRKLGS